MPKVFQLGYVALGVPDLERTRDYYVNALGTTEIDRDTSGACYLSVGFNHHDIVLRPQDDKALLHLGYQLNPGTDLKAFAKEAGDFGLQADVQSDAQPGIPSQVNVVGPGGNMFQFYTDMATPAPRSASRGVSPLRLGHVAVISPEADKLVTLYRDFLGFWETDWIGDLANFLTCNYEHHVVNVVKAPPSQVHHIAFQLHDSADHVRAADALRVADVPTKWGPSRHTAGHNLAAYHHDPDEVMIELYTDMDVYVPELNMCQPRPWHEDLPMTPRRWSPDTFSAWGVDFEFDLAQG